MFITRKHLSRRTVLQGMGAMVSLPFLEAMVPAQTRLSQTAASPRSRLACVEVVHGDAGSTSYGTDKNLRIPAKEGSDYEFTKILKPLYGKGSGPTSFSHCDFLAGAPPIKISRYSLSEVHTSFK